MCSIYRPSRARLRVWARQAILEEYLPAGPSLGDFRMRGLIIDHPEEPYGVVGALGSDEYSGHNDQFVLRRTIDLGGASSAAIYDSVVWPSVSAVAIDPRSAASVIANPALRLAEDLDGLPSGMEPIQIFVDRVWMCATPRPDHPGMHRLASWDYLFEGVVPSERCAGRDWSTEDPV